GALSSPKTDRQFALSSNRHSFRFINMARPWTCQRFLGPTCFASRLPSRQYLLIVSSVTPSWVAACREEYHLSASIFIRFQQPPLLIVWFGFQATRYRVSQHVSTGK